MLKKNILIVDDEPKILEVVSSFLTSKGYTVFVAQNAQEALIIFEQANILLIILDLMLPDLSGEEICQIIRKQSRVPIIMLSAKVAQNSLVAGLQMGADDYLCKPFSLKELLARIEAILRRATNDLVPLFSKNSYNNGNLCVDFTENIIKKNNEVVNLTLSEFKILAALIKYPHKVFTREELIETALGSEFIGFDRTVDSHIKNLRHKIEDNPKKCCYIVTVHGQGYKFGGE